MNRFADLRTLWELFLAGGPLMWPITAMSVLVVAFGLERAVALRRGRFVPRGLATRLREIGAGAPFDPRELAALCTAHPSVLATVTSTALERVGRPLPEIEQAVEAAESREASRLYANIRPITLAVTITPLLGLLGTVQGMIVAFYTTANLQAGANRASELAEVDAQLLTHELPPAAYADPGFVEFLRASVEDAGAASSEPAAAGAPPAAADATSTSTAPKD